MFAVADGLGGHRAGEFASAIVVACVHEAIRQRVARGPVSPSEARELVVRTLLDAHDTVRDAARGHDERFGMGSTAVLAWIPAGAPLLLANVGDSRGYLLRGTRLIQLSVDDTVLEELRRSGQLPERSADRPPRQMLSQALGPGLSVSPHHVEQVIRPGDRILLCSDGLTDMMSDPDIAEILLAKAAPQDTCERLVGEANLRGGLDNVTAVLIDVGPGRRGGSP